MVFSKKLKKQTPSKTFKLNIMKQDVNGIEYSNNLWEFLQYYIKKQK